MGEYMANSQIVHAKLGSEVCTGQSSDRPDPNFAHNIYMVPLYLYYHLLPEGKTTQLTGYECLQRITKAYSHSESIFGLFYVHV